MTIIGILLALVSAVLLSVSAQFQHHGVNAVSASHEKFSVRHFFRLFRQPRWVLGMVISAGAATLHLVGLGLAPVIVVQPVGIVALVLTAVFNRRVTHTRFTRRAVFGVLAAVIGLGVFVAFAALIAQQPSITHTRLVIVLIVLVAVLLITTVGMWFARNRQAPFLLILAGGSLHGFDAILLKSIIYRATHGLLFGGLTWLCLLGLVVAFSLGTYYVQRAYSVTSPDVVLSGLTVVDPLVAVIVGATVLGEASHVGGLLLSVFIISGALACFGVVQLTRDATHTKSLKALLKST